MPEVSLSFDSQHMDAAYAQAISNVEESAIPIGASMIYDDGEQTELFLGRNRRVQQNSAILHAEMDCLERAGSRPAEWYRHTTLFTTLFPCTMCSGAVALFGIPRVVIGEARNFPDAEGLRLGRAFLELHGVEYQILNESRCIEMLDRFIREQPTLWDADVPYQAS